MGKYDIFISYRRDGGEQSAKVIYDRLKDLGYNVFLDVETLRSGAFNRQLYSVIEECRDVLVILSPEALDRCGSEEDWVRLEIAHALRCKKNVVPVMLRGFTFPAELPEDIEAVRYQNGVQASVEFFDAFLVKLCSFLKSKPGMFRRLSQSLSWRRALIAVGCCILVAAGIWGSSVVIRQKALEAAAYPVTQKQRNEVKSLLYNVQINLTVMDNMFHQMENAITACEDYLKSGSPNGYADLVAQFRHTADTLQQQAEQARELSPGLTAALSGTKINMADLTALSQYPDVLLYSCGETLKSLEGIMDPKRPFDNVMRGRVLQINKELTQLEADSIFIGLCQLLLPVDEKALEDFRREYLPSLYVVSNRLSLWSRDETGLKSQQDSIYTQQQKLMNEYAQMVGDLNVTVLSEKEALIGMLVQEGMTREAAEAQVNGILEKSQNLRNSEQELDKVKQQLEASRERMREKFAPRTGDDPYLVWGKALRFLSAQMYDDAVAAMQFYLAQVKNSDENAAVYVPAAISFVRQIGSTGIDYGIIVTGYEPDKPPHAVYKVGDIITAIDSTPCRNFDEFEKLRKGMPSDLFYTATLLRPDEAGKLQPVDVDVPPGQSRVALMDLAEN